MSVDSEPRLGARLVVLALMFLAIIATGIAAVVLIFVAGSLIGGGGGEVYVTPDPVPSATSTQ